MMCHEVGKSEDSRTEEFKDNQTKFKVPRRLGACNLAVSNIRDGAGYHPCTLQTLFY